jgi:hypothetical protein
VQGLAVALLVIYAADWAVARVRVARGTAFGVVTVHQLLATPLKGQKEEYDYMGDAAMPCTRSIFPQAGNPPCWWLARHTTVWE